MKNFLLLLSAFAIHHSAFSAPPNVLLILADDLGYGDVRCYNADSKVPTPNIDKLASEGMRFTDAHSPATVCTPSRYSLMTGQMAFRVPNGGTVFQGTGGPSLIAPGKLTLPGMLKKQGYATAAVGKWHIGLTFRDQAGEAIHSGERAAVQRIDYSRRIEGGPLDHGFDQFFGTACCPTTEWLYAFIDGDHIPVPPTGPIDKSKLPKHPYANDCRAGFIAPDFPMEEVDLVFLKKSREFIAQHARTSPKQPFFLYHATQAVHLPSFAAPEFQGKSKAGPHGDFIAEFDHIVGELMRELDQHGLADNTLVILSSDNGPEVASVVHMRADHAHDGAKPWRGIKRDAWEGGHRVPFIVRWPGKVKAAPPAIKPSASPTFSPPSRPSPAPSCRTMPPKTASTCSPPSKAPPPLPSGRICSPKPLAGSAPFRFVAASGNTSPTAAPAETTTTKANSSPSPCPTPIPKPPPNSTTSPPIPARRRIFTPRSRRS
jgi:arylsulfatase A